MTEYRSFSQWSDMNTCPYSYYLKRVERVYQIQAAWTAGGTAIHEALEHWERSRREASSDEVTQVFEDTYDRLIKQAIVKEPNLSRWFASGPYTADVDIPRRREQGREQVTKALEWYEKHPEQAPWVHPDGRLGIELPFVLELDGVQVKGVVDWYGRLSATCALGPRDIKSGRNSGKHMQLKLYDLAMDDHFEWKNEERPGGGVGDFFMTRKGRPTVPQDLHQVDRDEVHYEFHQIDQKIREGDFPANPNEDNCKMCPVQRACKYRAV